MFYACNWHNFEQFYISTGIINTTHIVQSKIQCYQWLCIYCNHSVYDEPNSKYTVISKIIWYLFHKWTDGFKRIGSNEATKIILVFALNCYNVPAFHLLALVSRHPFSVCSPASLFFPAKDLESPANICVFMYLCMFIIVSMHVYIYIYVCVCLYLFILQKKWSHNIYIYIYICFSCFQLETLLGGPRRRISMALIHSASIFAKASSLHCRSTARAFGIASVLKWPKSPEKCWHYMGKDFITMITIFTKDNGNTRITYHNN